MSEEETPKRQRKVGQATGYKTDGTNYWLEPTYMESLKAIQDQGRALDSVVAAVTRTVAEARRHVEAQRRRWWDSVYRDLDLDASLTYQFDRIEGKLSPVVRDEGNGVKEGLGNR